MKLRAKRFAIRVTDRQGTVGYHCSKAGAQYNIHRAQVFNTAQEAKQVLDKHYKAGWYLDPEIFELTN
jgi:hypothetical protein